MSEDANGRDVGASPAAAGAGASAAFWRDALLTVIAALAVLHFGRSFLVPLSLALLLFVLLTALIDRIAALRLLGRPMPKWLAHAIGLALIFLAMAGVALILADQAAEVAAAAPRYAERMSDIAAAAVAFLGEALVADVRKSFAEIDMGAQAAMVAGSASGFLGAFFLVALYLPFMMFERRPLAIKLPLAAGDARRSARLVQLGRSISLNLQRYVGIKTLTSLMTGLATYAVAKPVGLDFAETWGLMAFLLNFIPTIGSIIGVALPSVVALVQFEELTPILVIVLGCGLAQFVIGNLVEPAMTGKSLNLSPLAIILSLTIWGTLWGGAGALLSVPITVSMMIICAHVPTWRWAAIMMSGDGVLPAQMTGEGDPDADVAPAETATGKDPPSPE